MRKKNKHFSKALALCLLLAAIAFLAASPQALWASASCGANLPTGPATMRVEVNEYDSCATILNSSTYLDTTLSGITGSFDIGNGTYAGTCVDLIGDILDIRYFGATYTVQMYSSLDIPSHLSSYPWNKINYVLNHPNRTNGAWNWLEVQAALWTLVHGCVIDSSTPNYPLWTCPQGPVGNPYRSLPFPYGTTSGTNYGCPLYGTSPDVNLDIVAAIVADANAHGMYFVPSSGQIYAIILDPQSCAGSAYCGTQYLDWQLTIIESRCTDCTGTIGDYVWHDLNRNGIQDAGETGIVGVTVYLKDASGAVLATKITGASGDYQFTGLCLGTYVVEVNQNTLPPGFTPTICNAGNDAMDSDADDSSACTPSQTVELTTAYPNNPTIDFGFVSPCTGTIGDYVWFDADRDGIQDADETGIEGVTVYLKDASGNTIDTKITGANGDYQFTGLCPGTYVVEVNQGTLPPGYTPTICNAGSDDALDSDAAAADCIPKQTVTLTETNQSDITIDFGCVSPCTGAIGNYVWYDADRDGIQDAGETGIQGVTVYLKGAGGAVLDTTTTGANGIYQFTGLCPGTYVVVIDLTTLPPGYTATQCNQGSDDAADSDADTADCIPKQTVTLTEANPSDITIDFGFVSPCTGAIGDYVWYDLDRNGIQDSGETGIQGVTVYLKNNLNQLLETTTTGAGGHYLFTGLCPGTYVVEVDSTTLPQGYKPTLCNQGSDDALDSDADDSSICTPRQTVELTATKPSDITIDFGFVSECGLAVDKKCYIVPAPSAPFVCSDAKPIDTMVVIWNGPAEPVTVKAWNGAIGTGVAQVINNVYKGNEVKFTRSGTYPNDVYFQIFDAAGVEIGRSTFHLSCSDVDMNGPEDCGKIAGDGKAVAGYQNWWIFDGMAGNGMVLDCTPSYPDGTDACSFVPPAPPSCATLGTKPKTLVFRYSSGGCAMSDNDQPADKAFCTATGSVISGPINVVYAGGNSNLSSDRYVVNPTAVAPNGTFEVSWNGADLKADSYFKVCDASGNCELNKIHTSCSQPLAVNDVFGSLTLVGFNGKYAGAEVKYLYEVKNLGSQSLTINSVLDDILGEQLAAPQTLAGGASLKLEDTVLVTGTITNKVTVSTVDPYCKATDSLTVSVTTPPPPDIDVQPVSDPRPGDHWLYWVLKNNGPDTATITKVEVTAWPSQQGKLKKIKLDGVTSADPADVPWPGPATVTSFVSDITARQIAAGQTRTFAIEFEKNYAITSNSNLNYKLIITFAGGEKVSWNIP